jgi:hypothetical protein
VSDIDDRIKNAIYDIANHVKVISYMVARDTANNVILVPKLEVDNSEIEPPIREIASETELLGKNPNLREIFDRVRTQLEKDGALCYTTSRSFRFKKDRVFAKLWFRKKYIQLELRVGRGKVVDPEFKYWRQGESAWGYTYIWSSKEISEKIIQWIDLARQFSTEPAGDEIDDGGV